ncbi:hypothetical protein I2200191F5_23590 [Blautia wexlerae]
MIIKDNMANMCAKVTSTYMEFTLALGVRTKSWTKLLFLNYVYTEMDSFHPTIF